MARPMRELVNFSVYPFDLEPFGDWPTALAHWRSLGLDGLELLTAFDGTGGAPKEAATAIHLPYCMDWYHLWQGRPLPEELGGEEPLHYFGGSSREEIVANLRRYLVEGATLEPDYAVFHLANASADEIATNRVVNDDNEVLQALVELLSEACAPLGGRPPMRLYFENLWWPGLTFLDAGPIEAFAEALPFDDWAFLLDVGHLLNTTDVTTEEEAGEYVLGRLDALPAWIVERIEAVHLHRSLSGPLRRRPGFFAPEGALSGRPLRERADEARRRLHLIDEHRPFETAVARALIDRIEPLYVVHELCSPTVEGKSEALLTQRRALGLASPRPAGDGRRDLATRRRPQQGDLGPPAVLDRRVSP